MMNFENNHLNGIHFIWWILGVLILVSGFMVLYYRPKSRVMDTPIEILKKRLAKGEITQDEFQEKKILVDS